MSVVLAIEQQGERCGGIGLAHQGFADEEGVIAGCTELGDVVCGADAAFGDHDGAGRQTGGKLDERVGADGEGAQVAAVDADEVEAEIDGAVDLFAVVGFAEDVEADERRLRRGDREGGVSVGGDDQEDGVGSGGAGLEDLKGVEDEVLAEAGNLHGGGGGSRSSSEPWKNRSSVRTERAAAPAAQRCGPASRGRNRCG